MTEEVPQQMFSTSEVARKTGATLRQLQWWDECSILRPAGGIRERRRLYTVEQVAIAERLVHLRRAGVSMQDLRQFPKLPERKTVITTKRSAVVVGDVLVVFKGNKK